MNAKARRYAMTMDTRKCVGCQACVLACKNENNVPEGFCRDWIVQEVHGTFPDLTAQIRSERCHHCTNAPCVSVCPTGASYQGDGGIVQVTHDKCTGCKACIAACPYDARYVHPDGYVDKCTFCAHRVARGDNPACVSVCPTDSLAFGDLMDDDSPVSALLASRRFEVLLADAGTQPNLFFLV